MANGIVLLYVFLTAASGFSQGARRQLWSLVVLAASAYFSGNAYIALLPLARTYIENEAACRVASFVLVFVIASALLSWTASAVLDPDYGRSADHLAGDRIAGALLGVVHAVGVLEVFAAVVITYPVWQWDRWVREADLLVAAFVQLPFMMLLLPAEFQPVLAALR